MPIINSLTWGEIRVAHADIVFTSRESCRVELE